MTPSPPRPSPPPNPPAPPTNGMMEGRKRLPKCRWSESHAAAECLIPLPTLTLCLCPVCDERS